MEGPKEGGGRRGLGKEPRVGRGGPREGRDRMGGPRECRGGREGVKVKGKKEKSRKDYRREY